MIMKSRTSDTTETRNPCVIKVILLACFTYIDIFFNLLNLFWHTDKNVCFYAEINFWDFVWNDNSNKGTTARLNETWFGPKKKSSPIYLGPKNLDTFWCIGWAWNCQIISRCASIHGRAGFILFSTDLKCVFNNFWQIFNKC
jgi:hypothetical protein